MGFFDKLKSVSNFLTGNSAEVTMEIPTVTRGVPFTVIVKAKIKDADLKINKAYFKINAFEKIEKMVPETEGEKEFEENETFDFSIDLEGSTVLKANETYSWQKEITIPENTMPTVSTYPNHYWLCLAGLDVKGNDPDTGWKDLLVS